MNNQEYVASLIERSKKAQEIAAKYNQEKVEQLIAAIAYGVTQEDFRRKIAEMLVEESGMGSVEDKIGKMLSKVKQVYYQNKDELSCDLVEVNEITGIGRSDA